MQGEWHDRIILQNQRDSESTDQRFWTTQIVSILTEILGGFTISK